MSKHYLILKAIYLHIVTINITTELYIIDNFLNII